MNFLDHPLPSRQGFLAVEVRHIGIKARARMRNVGPFGHDQAHSAFGAAAIIGRHVRSGDAAGRFGARHGRHHDPVRKGRFLMVKGLNRTAVRLSVAVVIGVYCTWMFGGRFGRRIAV